jgi:adenylate cyclase
MPLALLEIIKNKYAVLIAAFSLSAFIFCLRGLGALQGAEMQALDLFFTNRFSNTSEDRIVLVTVSERDIEKLQEYPLSDRSLTSLLEKINAQKPRVIGLDIFRNFPVPSLKHSKQENYQAYSELEKIFRNTPNLYGIAKLTDSDDSRYNSSKISPPNALKQTGGYGAADLLVDDDDVVRRGYLYPVSDRTADAAIPSLGLAVALHYLSDEHIYPTMADVRACPIASQIENKKLKFKNTQSGWLKIKDTVLCPFTGNDGGYVGADDFLNGAGYQTLLNWRSCDRKFLQVSVTDILNNKIQKNLFENRIVLIGNSTDNYKDSFLTPCSHSRSTNANRRMLGVEIQANLASQIVSIALDKFSSLKVWLDWQEFVWICVWTFPTIVYGYKNRYRKFSDLFLKIFFSILICAIALLCISYVAFNFSWWLPIIPPLLGIIFGGIAIGLFLYIKQLLNINVVLEERIKERTQKLEYKNEQLAHVVYQLKSARRQMIARERLESLGKNVAGLAHEIRNPLNLINQYNALSVNSGKDLQREINRYSDLLEVEIVEKLSESSAAIVENLDSSKQQIERIDNTIQSVIQQLGKGHEKPSLTNINDLVDDALKQACFSFKSIHKNFKIKIETNYDRAINKIYIYPGDFARAVINLVDNACYAVYKKSQNNRQDYLPTISLTTKDWGSSLKILISDNGVGIPADKIEEIFKEFVTTKSNGEGVGLGLFIVKEIIEGKHQGKVEVDRGEYTTFSITIPKFIKTINSSQRST